MNALPAVAALGCRSCRLSIFRALAGTAGPASSRLPLHRPPLRIPVRLTKSFSQQGHQGSEVTAQAGTPRDGDESGSSLAVGEAREQPWFLDVEPPRHIPTQHATTLPKIPDDAPTLLGPMMKYIWEDMGLDDISLMDLRDLDQVAALGPNLIMLFGTARSERHLHVSAGRFVRWLRRNHNVGAKAGGLIGPGELKTKLRRLRKKAKLMGTNTAIVPGGDNGISTGWVCVHFGTGGDNTPDSASFDAEGKISGFGTPQPTGTTIVVQCMTEARRNELDLESLWQGILRRSLERSKKVEGQETPDKGEVAQMVSSRVQLASSPSAQQWQALRQASLQQRRYSTSVRRPGAARFSPGLGSTTAHRYFASAADPEKRTPCASWEALQEQVSDIRASGSPFNQQELQHLTRESLSVSSSVDVPIYDRLALIDQLLHTAESRGMVVLSDTVLVGLLESILYSPHYGPELHQAQENLYFLLSKIRTHPDEGTLLRLMAAYAYRHDWSKFWDAFRTPPRFRVARSPNLYTLAYRALADSNDTRACVDALRWVYPEMLHEQPPVLPVGPVFEALEACILVADPIAQSLLDNPPNPESLDVIGQRRLAVREFPKLLRDVQRIQREVTSQQEAEAVRLQNDDRQLRGV